MTIIPNPPKLSVVMPVYHADDFLESAITSILQQSFSDFEFIIICDDPSIKTKEILDYYGCVDSRIKVHYGPESGLVDSLNMGCQYAKGQYIARMDADDISISNRFEKQIAFLDNHPEIGVCGSWMEVINKHGQKLKTRMPPSLPKIIQWALMFNCCIAHPTVIMRKDLIEKIGFYRKAALHIEDYDLWTRLCCITQIANIPYIFTKYRYHGENISKLSSKENPEKKASISFEISIQHIHNTLDNQFDDKLQSIFKKWKCGHQMSVAEIQSMNNLIERISNVYEQIHPLDVNEKKEMMIFKAFLLLNLAFRIKNISRLKAFEYVLKAIRLDPSLLIQFPDKIRFARLYKK